VDPKLKCKKCSGKKVNRERKILEVSFIKKGTYPRRRKNEDVVIKHISTRHLQKGGGGG
jgi:ribosomal protein L22